MSKIILSAAVGVNADLFPGLLKLYVPEGSVVADVTYGHGNFWKQVVNNYNLKATDLSMGVDCRKLPYDDNAIDAVVLDPPYVYNPKATVKTSISNTYNINTTTELKTINAVVQLYVDAMREALRVLKHKGILIVKCQDQIESGKQRWIHIELYQFALSLGMIVEDMMVLVQKTQPTIRWPQQKHTRKNHSYFWVFKANKKLV